MIYLFRIISDENPEFFRDLVAAGSDTFLDYHMTLQKDLAYDPTQLASFIITNHEWEKEKEITLMDMMQDPGLESLTMDRVKLEEQIMELNQPMLYLFDFFSERAFFIELVEISDQISTRRTPFIAHGEGEPPPQLSMDLLMDDTSEFEDFDPTDNPGNLRFEDMDPELSDSESDDDF
jgi:hypothetical protein